MKNRAIIIRLRDYILSLTYQELKDLTRQTVIDNIDPAFTAEELEDFNNSFAMFRKYFKRVWIDVQHANLKQNSILPAMITARDTVIADMAVIGLSSATATKLFKQILSDMLEGE